MEGDTKHTRVFDGVQPASAEVRSEMNERNKETPYWGVLCRTCRELVAFDTCPYMSFGPEAASMKPGAIRCGQGHNHIYFPRDFQFCASAAPIPDAVMGENRELYRAINSPGLRTSHDSVSKVVEPSADPAAEAPVRGPEPVKTRPESLVPDPRREAAQSAAKARWTNWAGLKVR
jgi:hypothetical protein